MALKVVSKRGRGVTSENPDTGLRAVPCLNCGRIWVQTRDKGTEECPECGNELYSSHKRIDVGKELRLPDGLDVRVGQDRLMREAATTMQGLINQTVCDCTKGVRCFHCQGIAILRDFPGPEEGSMEDDWATLRGKKTLERSDPVNAPVDDRSWYNRLLDEEDTLAPRAYAPMTTPDEPDYEDNDGDWATFTQDWESGDISFPTGTTVQVTLRADGQCFVADLDGVEAWVPESILRPGENLRPVQDIFSEV
jgi:predicted  nucleic acid-binding Zn-ribbon protein